MLRESIGEERNKREKLIQEAEEEGQIKMAQYKDEHIKTVDALNKELKKLETDVAGEIKKNKDEEKIMRGMYKTRDDELRNNINAYDVEIGIAEETKAKMQADYDDSAHDLNMLKDEYELLREEARKREEIARILAEKEAVFTEKMNKLE